MFDAALRKRIDPTLDRIGRGLAARGATANAITLAGLALGLAAALAIGLGAPLVGLALIALSRLADGLDGAVARVRGTTDFGGYLDITCDFLFYGAIPLGFAFLNPDANALAAAGLLLSFYANGASFLGFAILAEKRGLVTTARGVKNLFFSGGLLEGSETIGFFVLLCLVPGAFAPLAWIFAGLCFATAVGRVMHARQIFT